MRRLGLRPTSRLEANERSNASRFWPASATRPEVPRSLSEDCRPLKGDRGNLSVWSFVAEHAGEVAEFLAEVADG